MFGQEAIQPENLIGKKKILCERGVGRRRDRRNKKRIPRKGEIETRWRDRIIEMFG